MEWFVDLDTQLLLLVNGNHTQFLDSLMWLISARPTWIVFYLGLLFCVIKNAGTKTSIAFIFSLSLAIILTDQICATLLRPLMARLRPSNPANPLSSMIVLVNNYTSGKYGFPSCHAANTAAAATLISLLFKNRLITATMTLWVILICYSRLYLGVHYLSDILGGVIVGVTISCVIYYLTSKAIAFNIRRTGTPLLPALFLAVNLLVLVSLSTYKS